MTTITHQADAAYQRLWAAWIAGQLDAAHIADLAAIAQAIDHLKQLEQQ